MNHIINNNSFTKDALTKHANEMANSNAPEWQKKIFQFITNYLSDKLTIAIQSSGTTGKAKIWQIEKSKMRISAAKTAAYFNFKKDQRVLLVLPVDYIAGKMMIVRALEHGLQLICKEPKVDFLREVDTDESFYFCPVTPLQAKVSLANSSSLKKIQTIEHILLGGAPIDAELANEPLVSNDLVNIKDMLNFEWLGRYDNVINSGGIKIIPEQIEAKLEPYIDKPFFITSSKDDLLGERLILLIEAEKNYDINTLKNQINIMLPKHNIPKEIKLISQFDRTSSGKIKRQKL